MPLPRRNPLTLLLLTIEPRRTRKQYSSRGPDILRQVVTSAIHFWPAVFAYLQVGDLLLNSLIYEWEGPFASLHARVHHLAVVDVLGADAFFHARVRSLCRIMTCRIISYETFEARSCRCHGDRAKERQRGSERAHAHGCHFQDHAPIPPSMCRVCVRMQRVREKCYQNKTS